ncbi:MAG: hypothetical protein US22_C0001G0007 [candidate division TM6 bacterium GW2011_GWF2_36_6]|nr:MAG: hypothetical protein US22_C0001G0007 [candidate division TM6 bacterium GW2011_GWF2_36_6]
MKTYYFYLMIFVLFLLKSGDAMKYNPLVLARHKQKASSLKTLPEAPPYRYYDFMRKKEAEKGRTPRGAPLPFLHASNVKEKKLFVVTFESAYFKETGKARNVVLVSMPVTEIVDQVGVSNAGENFTPVFQAVRDLFFDSRCMAIINDARKVYPSIFVLRLTTHGKVSLREDFVYMVMEQFVDRVIMIPKSEFNETDFCEENAIDLVLNARGF